MRGIFHLEAAILPGNPEFGCPATRANLKPLKNKVISTIQTHEYLTVSLD